VGWYLSQVAKTSVTILEKSLDKLSYKQLSIIKSGFKTQFMNGNNYILLKEQIANQHDIVSIEQFKEYFLRLIEVNPIIKELLEKPIKI
jgi:hypothetical protein